MSTTKSPSRDPAANRATILEAAEQIFSQKGFAATSMRDLAEASGTSKALIHHHFGSKDDLYAAVKSRVIDRYWKTQQPQFNMADDGAKFLVEASRTFFHFCRDNPQVGRLGAWAQLEGDRTPWPGVEKICPLVIERIRKAQEEGVVRGDFHPALLMTALTALVVYWWQFKEAHADQFADYPHAETLDEDYFYQAMEIFLHGAAGPGFPQNESKTKQHPEKHGKR